MKVVLTDFAKERHFDPDKPGTTIAISPQDFEAVVNGLVVLRNFRIRDGYADFCKLLFVENWTEARAGTLPIDDDNRHLLRSGYKARTEDELPVLGRWLEVDYVPKASHLCLVLYHRDQLLKEDTDIGEADYGIVAILGQMHDNEEPMPPVTMMRNALGVREGGSGVPLDREAYGRSVEFWENHAVVKVTNG